MCDKTWYKQNMMCDSAVGKRYTGQFMEHVKIIIYVSYMVHRIFVQATLNT
jgi:hypothetical protein